MHVISTRFPLSSCMTCTKFPCRGARHWHDRITIVYRAMKPTVLDDERYGSIELVRTGDRLNGIDFFRATRTHTCRLRRMPLKSR
jgi:hypothetical protein